MARNDKVSRKELLKEPDRILTRSRRLFAFILTHRVKAMAALGAIFAVTIIVSGFQFFAERQEARAFALLEDGREQFRTASRAQSAAEAYAAVRPHFESLISDHGNRNGGRLARLVFADMALRAADFDKAAELYSRALKDFGDDPALRDLVLSGLAHAHEGKGAPEAAIPYFERIAAGKDSFLKGDALFQLGRIHRDMGDPEKSREHFERLLEEFPDFVHAELVRERLGRS
jgi:tetratricopeptide (TPR) repeat protein